MPADIVDEKMVDVAIVGAGPAGAATALRALQLRPDAKVLLLDASAFPRDKACGDGIAAVVFDLLDGLGVPDLAALTRDVPLLRLRTPRGRTVCRRCRQPNRVIPRTVFDAELVAAAVRGGAQLRRHRVRSMQVLADRVVLDDTIAARVVVGADGANSTVRRLIGAPRTPAATTAVAIRGYTPHSLEPDTMVIEFAPGPVPAYAWSFPLADGGANVGFGVIDRRGSGSRRELLEALATLLPGQPPDPGSVRGHQLPLSVAPRWHPPGRVLLVGDAAAMINPLTGEGIYDAVASGVLAGRAALEGAGAGGAHRHAVRRAFGRHHRHTSLLARMMRRPGFVDAAVNTCARREDVFDAAVELGLGRGTAPASALARVAASYVTGGRR